MRILSFVVGICCSTLVCIQAAEPVVNPVADYKARHQKDIGSTDYTSSPIIEFEVDINNDGNKDVFVSRKNVAALADYQNTVLVWDLYLKRPDGKFQLMDAQNVSIDKSHSQIMSGQSFAFDPDKFFVGFIPQIKGRGLLAMYYLQEHNGVELSIYVIKGGYFEQLNFPSPDVPTTTYHRDDSGNIPDHQTPHKPFLVRHPSPK